MDAEPARVAQELPVASADRVQVHLRNLSVVREKARELTLDVTAQIRRF